MKDPVTHITTYHISADLWLCGFVVLSDESHAGGIGGYRWEDGQGTQEQDEGGPNTGIEVLWKKHDSHGAVGGTIHGYKESFYSPIPPFPC